MIARYVDPSTEQLVEAGALELYRPIPRGYRNPDKYRLRLLLVYSGLDRTAVGRPMSV